MFHLPPAYRVLLAAVLLAVSGCVSTRINPERATITHRAEFPFSDSVRIAHYPRGGFALQRFDRDQSMIVEGYNDTLGLMWSHLYYYNRVRTLRWLGHHKGKVVAVWKNWHLPDGVTELENWERTDSTAVWAYSHDPLTGAFIDSMRLAVHGAKPDRDFQTVIEPQILTTPDSSLLVSYSVDIPLHRWKDFDSVRVHASLFDADMRVRGSFTFTLPIVPIDTVQGYHYRLPGRPVLDSLGRLYLAVAVGPETIRVIQADIPTGTITALDITTAPVFPKPGLNEIQNVIVQPNESGKVVIAVSEKYNLQTQGVTLYQLDFRTRSLDFARVIDFTKELRTRPDAKELTNSLMLSRILTSPEYGSIILAEEMITHFIPTYTRDRFTNEKMRSGGSTVYEHRGMVLMRIDTLGVTRWIAIQNREAMLRRIERFATDIWRFDGGMLHYLTRSVFAGTVDLADGSMALPVKLLTTDLHGNYDGVRWFDPGSAILLLRDSHYNSIVKIRY